MDLAAFIRDTGGGGKKRSLNDSQRGGSKEGAYELLVWGGISDRRLWVRETQRRGGDRNIPCVGGSKKEQRGLIVLGARRWVTTHRSPE